MSQNLSSAAVVIGALRVKDEIFVYIYLHFHCVSLNEPLQLKCPSYLPEQIGLNHAHIHTIWVNQRQYHPITLFVYRRLHDVEHILPLCKACIWHFGLGACSKIMKPKRDIGGEK